MLIKSYGLFWRADEIDWNPGKGKKDTFRLLGRQGKNCPSLRVADMRDMQGIYILYGDYGPYYVGLTRKQGLGKRVKDHLTDGHKGLWDRFSWYGFQKVLKRTVDDGLRGLGNLAKVRGGRTDTMIGDIEALLIKAMGLRNIAQMKFDEATEWHQVRRPEVEHYLRKVAP